MTAFSEISKSRLDRMFPWERLDREAALARPDLLRLVREACLIESYFAVFTARMMRLLWYDVTATSILSIEAFEAFVHYATLRRYLDEVGVEPVTDEEIRALRAKDLDEGPELRRGDAPPHDLPLAEPEHAAEHDLPDADPEHAKEHQLPDADPDDATKHELRELVNFMVTEHFAAQYFRDLGAETDEPVLKAIMQRFAPEEDVHADLAGELIRARVDGRDDLVDLVVRYAREFRHVGAYVLPSVSNVRQDNARAILALDRKVEALVGKRLTARDAA